MENKYEYKVSESKIITLSNVANQNPNAAEFGWFIGWLCSKNNGCIGYKDEVVNSRIVSMLVADGKFSWLDWLAEKGFVTKMEKKRKLTIEDFSIEELRDGFGVLVAGKIVLAFSKSGDVWSPRFAQNDLIPTDEDGKIIIK